MSTRTKILLAFASVYLIWGSTYLAIKFAVAVLPPLLMAGTRFIIAGGILIAWSLWKRKIPAPSLAQWAACLLVGTFLLCGGNGFVVFAARRLPSGLVALLISATPFFMVLFDWLWGSRARPHLRTLLGLVAGVVGVGLLVGPSNLLGAKRPDPIGVAFIMTACASWAAGSILSRKKSKNLPPSQLLATGMEMFSAGLLMTVIGVLIGEGGELHLNAITAKSLISWAYLVTFGSLIGFSAYIYVLGATTPAKAATYAYVNPVVAVFLGWALGGEPLAARTLVAAAVIIGAVVLITAPRNAPPVAE